MPRYWIAVVIFFVVGGPFCWGNAGTIKTNVTSWNAGTVVLGYQNQTTITITNTSNIAVTIDSVSLAGTTDFKICCATFPKVIPPHGIMNFGIVFAPTIAEPESTTATVMSTAINKPYVSLSGSGHVYTVDLTWDASPSATDPCWGNIHYNVYIGTTNGSYTLVPGGPIVDTYTSGMTYIPDGGPITSTYITVGPAQPGQTYSYEVTAVADYIGNGSSCPNPTQSGLESGPSNVTSVLIPTP